MFYVYVIKNELSNKIYIGQTADLEKRLKRHNGELPVKKKGLLIKTKASGYWFIMKNLKPVMKQ